MERKTLDVAWKDAAAGDGVLVGYASTFGNVDKGGDVVVPGAFAETIRDLKASNGIPLLADHVASTASVLGTIYDAKEDARGLVIWARFSSVPTAQEVRTKLREGHLSKLSIGYETLEEAYDERDGNRVRLLRKVKLWETSVVVFPMNPAASVSRVKALDTEPARSAVLADWLVTEELLLALDRNRAAK